MRVIFNRIGINIRNFEKSLLKGDISLKHKLLENNINKWSDSLVTEETTCPNTFHVFTSFFLNWPSTKRGEIVYEMRRDRGGTMRKKLNRERRKKERKHRKENADVYK